MILRSYLLCSIGHRADRFERF
ncbi:unnamed protein product, partial [Allacma fusca]